MHERYTRLVTKMVEALVFVDHIQKHLKPDEEVMCKICGKTVSEIIKD